MKTLLSLILLSLILASQSLCAQPIQKHRVIILTDIEADPDDTMSMVRLLLYSDEIDIKGLIAIHLLLEKNKCGSGFNQ